MIIHATSGLHGELIAFVATRTNTPWFGLDGLAIIRRDPRHLGERCYSTHRLFTHDGEQLAESGHYDLTAEEAFEDLLDRVGPNPLGGAQ